MIQPVDRPDDPGISDYAHVGDPAWLRARNLFVAEGRLVVVRLLATRRFRIRSVLVTSSAQQALALDTPGVPVFVGDPALLKAVTGFNFHRGCLAIAERPADTELSAVSGATRLLALEGVGNPDNVGGLFRVAAAFGVGGVLLDESCADPLYRKAVRTSMGAALTIPFARLARWPSDLAQLRSAGFVVAALTPRAEAVDVREAASCAYDKLVLLLGAEGPGLSAGALRLADVQLRIPMAAGVDSLNVTVAAGVALSHLA